MLSYRSRSTYIFLSAADARNSIAQSGPYAYMMVQTDYRHLYMLLASNEAILAGFLENSHDLMNNLKVALDVAESGEDGSELMACAQLMGEVIERQEKMVVDLLQMAQLKEKAQAHHFEYEELSRTIGVRN